MSGGAPGRTARVGLAGCGVTGTQVAELLGRIAGVEVSVFDVDNAASRRVATSVEGAVVGTVEDLLTADVVVLCQPPDHAELARSIIEAGAAGVSISDDIDDVRELLDLDGLAALHDVPFVVGAAMAPGLSGLIARHLAGQLDELEELHVAVHGTGGPECARRHHRSLGDRAYGWHDGRWIERPGGSGRELCWFPEPMGAHDCYRAAVADPLLLHHSFPSVSRISARVSGTRRDRLTARLPMLTPPHSGGNSGAVRVEARGSIAGGARSTVIAGAAGRTERLAAAVCAASVHACLERAVAPGVHTLGATALGAANLLYRATGFGVRVQEFTGVARPTTW